MFRSVEAAFKGVRIKNVKLSKYDNPSRFYLFRFDSKLALLTTEYRNKTVHTIRNLPNQHVTLMVSVITLNYTSIHEDIHVLVVAVKVCEENNTPGFHFRLTKLPVQVFDEALRIVDGRMEKLTRLQPPSV